MIYYVPPSRANCSTTERAEGWESGQCSPAEEEALREQCAGGEGYWPGGCVSTEETKWGPAAHDPISNPAHYNRFGGPEPIEIAEHLSFCLGSALKYIARAGHKGDAIEDLQKAAWYIARELDRLERTRAMGLK